MENKVVPLDLAVFSGYLVLTFTTLLFHEPWFDEAQAWLIARDLPWKDIPAQMQYEGTPALWHFILALFAKSGMPYFFMSLFHWVLGTFIFGYLFFKAPFPRFFKYPLLFFYFISFEYVIIARSYLLGIFFLFLIASVYHKRFKIPWVYGFLLFLLSMSTLQTFFLTFFFLLADFYCLAKKKAEGKQVMVSAFLGTMGILLTVLQLLPTPDNYNKGLFTYFKWKAPIVSFANALFPVHPSIDFPPRLLYFMGLLGILFMAFALKYLKTSRTSMFLFLGGLGSLFYIFIFKHYGAFRHHGFVFIFLLAALWIREFRVSKPPDIKFYRIFAFLLIPGILGGAYTSYLDIRFPFSAARVNAKALEDAINKYHPEEIATIPHSKDPAILPYLPEVKFYYLGLNQDGTFLTWTQDQKNIVKLPPTAMDSLAEDYLAKNPENLVILPQKYGGHKLKEVYSQEISAFHKDEWKSYFYISKAK